MAGKASANSRIRVAVLGVNGRGRDHIFGFNALPNAEVVMLCDPDSNLLAERAEQFETRYRRKVQTEQDLRKVFDNQEIDAVSVATPQSLARAGHHLGVPGRQGCVRRKARRA
jgi:predicted dehydrogenase